MSTTDKVVGAAYTGISWTVKTVLAVGLGGALVGAALGAALGTSILAAAGVGVLAAGVVGVGFGSGLLTLIGGIGAIKGWRDAARLQQPSMEQQLEMERQRAALLQSQLINERQLAAGGYSNPDATTGHAARLAEQKQMQSGVTQTLQ